MKILINTHQLDLLTSNCHISEDGLTQNGQNLITESKIPVYSVSIYVQGQPAEIRIGAYSSGAALSIARKLFGKDATITGSTTLIR
jgi:hypothetical protein